MSVAYALQYLDSVDNLPSDVQPDITSVRQIHARCTMLQQEAQELIADVRAELDSSERAKLLAALKVTLKQIVEAQDEKAQLANACHDVVRQQSHQLGNLLTEYKSGAYLVQRDPAADEHAPSPSPAPAPPAPPPKQVVEKRKRVPEEEPVEAKPVVADSPPSNAFADKKQNRAKANSAKKPKVVQKEEKYCVPGCKLSDQEMVGCDNESCAFGSWFHLPCISLKSAPTTKTWYCPQCRPIIASKSRK